MRDRALNGLMAALLVAFLLLGALAITTDVRANHAGTHAIRGVVWDSQPPNLPVAAQVTLVEAHGGFTIGPTTSANDGTFSFSPAPGRYFVTVEATGFFRKSTEATLTLFNGSVDVDLPTIYLERFGGSSSVLTIITEPGARVAVVNVTNNQIVASKDSNATTGQAVFGLWNQTAWVRVNKTGKQTGFKSVPILGNTTAWVNLTASTRVFANVRDQDGNFVRSGVSAFLYDRNFSTFGVWKRLIAANVQGSAITFDAYTGNFILMVDASGFAGKVNSLAVPTSPTGNLNDNTTTRAYVTLTKAPESVVRTEVRFWNNWSALTLYRNVTLAPDGVIEGMPFGFVHNAELQADLALGNQDGALNSSEVTTVDNALKGKGVHNLTTEGFLLFNGKKYSAAGDFTLATSFSAPTLSYTSSVTYYLLPQGSTLPQNQKQYFLNVTVRQDIPTTSTNFDYFFALRPFYERTSATVVAGSATVTNFTTIRVNPGPPASPTSPAYARVNMVLQTSKEGTAFWKVVGPKNPDRFFEWNSDLRNYSVVVAQNVNIQFSGEDSTYLNSPDNRAPAEFNYTWRVGYGAALSATLYAQKPTYNFTSSGMAWVNLTLRYPSLNTSYKNNSLTVDGTPPFGGSIQVTFNAVVTTTVDEKAKVRFTAKDWVDDISNGIRRYDWDFNADGAFETSSGVSPNYVEYSFPNPGTFNVTLTVVDHAGNTFPTPPVTVTVRDVSKPNVAFTISNPQTGQQNVESLSENISYAFDAKATTDNFDQEDQLTFAWSFGDTTGTVTGDRVTHTYANYGTYTVSLAVTDRAGNKQWNNRSLSVTPEYGARPDLAVKNLKLDPTKPEESTPITSSSVKVSFEVTNNGEVTASQVSIYLVAFRQGEETAQPIRITDAQWFLGEGTSDATLGAHQTKRVEFRWNAGAAGNWTIRVNATDAREPPQRTADNVVAIQNDVQTASWKTPAIVVAVVGVIGGIIALPLIRRRRAARAEEEEEGGGERLTRRQRANRKAEEEE